MGANIESHAAQSLSRSGAIAAAKARYWDGRTEAFDAMLHQIDAGASLDAVRARVEILRDLALAEAEEARR